MIISLFYVNYTARRSAVSISNVPIHKLETSERLFAARMIGEKDVSFPLLDDIYKWGKITKEWEFDIAEGDSLVDIRNKLVKRIKDGDQNLSREEIRACAYDAAARAKQAMSMSGKYEKERSAGRLSKLVTLTCSCCGQLTKGRQWHNRDNGYGLCNKCADRFEPTTPDNEMLSNYGRSGTHYRV